MDLRAWQRRHGPYLGRDTPLPAALLALLTIAGCLLGVKPARADETPSTPTLGHGYAELSGAVGVTSGSLAGHTGVVPGFQVEFGVGPKGLPLSLGVLGGRWQLHQQVWPGPTVVTATTWEISARETEFVRSIDIAHFELALRLEPERALWNVVRPFASVSAGLAVLWMEDDTTGEGPKTEDVSLARSVTLGIDLEPFGRHPNGSSGLGAVLLTVGVRGFQTGPLFVEPNEASAAGTRGGSLRVVAPFVGLSLAGWS